MLQGHPMQTKQNKTPPLQDRYKMCLFAFGHMLQGLFNKKYNELCTCMSQIFPLYFLFYNYLILVKDIRLLIIIVGLGFENQLSHLFITPILLIY